MGFIIQCSATYQMKLTYLTVFHQMTFRIMINYSQPSIRGNAVSKTRFTQLVHVKKSGGDQKQESSHLEYIFHSHPLDD
jgi:hypothetical protein